VNIFISSFLIFSFDLILIYFLNDVLNAFDKSYLIIIVGLLLSENIYKFRYDFWQEFFKVSKVVVFSYFLILLLILFNKELLDNLNIYFFMLLILFPMYKFLIKYFLFKNKFFNKKIYIISNDDDSKNILKNEIEENRYMGFILSNFKEADAIFLISDNYKEISRYINKFAFINKKLYISPILKDINFIHSHILDYINIQSNYIYIENKLVDYKNLLLKIFFDILLMIPALILFVFIHFFVYFFIKMESGGRVFFKQKRLGKDGEFFYCYKYRTMYENGDKILKEYLKVNPDEVEYYEKYHKYKNDPRITKVGKILRKYSIDELPQVINVLKFEMSFIGPRPYMVEEGKKVNNLNLILKVRPGLTGLWQVSGRNDLTFEKRNALDMWYIKNWSLWLDFVILLKTFRVVLFKVGAR